MNKLRNDKDKGTWIPPEVKEMLEALWEDPAWVEKCRKNSQNRRSDMGVSLHTGGSIPFPEHKKRMVSSSY